MPGDRVDVEGEDMVVGADGAPKRICTWSKCDEPAIDGSPYCLRHADVITPDKLRAMMSRLNAPRKAAIAAVEAARRSAQVRSDTRRARRRAATQSRQKQRPTKGKKDHGRKKP